MGLSMNLTIWRASRNERPVVERLLQLCLHDYTSHDPFAIGDDGLFIYNWTDLYWSSPHRHPFLCRVEDRLAGFALVREWDEDEPGGWDWQLAEFFVLRSLRRKGVGTQTALRLFQAKPGRWGFSYDVANTPAKVFWEKIAAYFDADLRPIPIAPGREGFLVEVRPEETEPAAGGDSPE